MNRLMARLRLERLDDRILPSTVIYTETDTWTGPNSSTATVTATVTQQDDGTDQWNYHVLNNSFTYGADNYWGIGTLVIPVADSSLVSNVNSSNGADWSTDSLLTQGDNVTWFFANETNPGMMPGQAADFWFTTPLQAIAAVGGQGLSYDLGEEVAGPTDGPVAPPVITLTVGNNNFIPLNANDTFGAPLFDGVPMQDGINGTGPIFDFQVNPMRQWVQVGPEQLKDDPDLVQASFNVANPVPGGTVVVNVTLSNAQNHGQIRLWKERDKWTDYGAQNPHALTDNVFYIEGDEPSTALNDITITAIYNFGPGAQSVQTSQTVTVTVTPMINNFSIIPRQAPNVTFSNTKNGLTGLTTQGGQAQGVTDTATLTRTGVGGKGTFIQNVVGLDNGVNGAPAGWVFTPASGQPSLNTMLTLGSLPILDTGRVTTPPPDLLESYPLDTADTLQITAVDSPTTGYPDGSADLKDIDVRYIFILYLLWRFPDNTIYTLALSHWQVTFRATNNKPGESVQDIISPSGITSDQNNYTISHTIVPARAAPTFNQSVQIR